MRRLTFCQKDRTMRSENCKDIGQKMKLLAWLCFIPSCPLCDTFYPFFFWTRVQMHVMCHHEKVLQGLALPQLGKGYHWKFSLFSFLEREIGA